MTPRAFAIFFLLSTVCAMKHRSGNHGGKSSLLFDTTTKSQEIAPDLETMQQLRGMSVSEQDAQRLIAGTLLKQKHPYAHSQVGACCTLCSCQTHCALISTTFVHCWTTFCLPIRVIGLCIAIRMQLYTVRMTGRVSL